MKLMKHVAKVKTAVETAHNAMEDALMKRDNESQRIKEKAAKDPWYTQQQATADNEKSAREFSEEWDAAIKAFNEQVDAARKELQNDLHAYYKPDGAKIVKADTELLTSGINLTLDEVGEMLQANADNVTMLRIITQYARKQKYENIPSLLERTFCKVEKAGEAEKQAFDRFVGIARTGMSMKDSTYIHVQRSLERLYAEAEIDFMRAKLVLTAEELEAINAKESENRSKFANV